MATARREEQMFDPASTTSGPGPGVFRADGDQSSMANLFGRLLNDATALLRSELALARAEFMRAADNAKAAAVASAVAVAVLLFGSAAIVAAVILALAKVMEPWAAALCVGLALAI